MQSRSVDVEGRRVVIVVADKGDDAVAAITDAAGQQHAEVWPTLEVVLSEVGPELAKRLDPQTGLALIDLS